MLGNRSASKSFTFYVENEHSYGTKRIFPQERAGSSAQSWTIHHIDMLLSFHMPEASADSKENAPCTWGQQRSKAEILCMDQRWDTSPRAAVQSKNISVPNKMKCSGTNPELICRAGKSNFTNEQYLEVWKHCFVFLNPCWKQLLWFVCHSATWNWSVAFLWGNLARTSLCLLSESPQTTAEPRCWAWWRCPEAGTSHSSPPVPHTSRPLTHPCTQGSTAASHSCQSVLLPYRDGWWVTATHWHTASGMRSLEQ